MSWREFILALGLHTAEEMQTAGFGLYWTESARWIPNKGDLRDYWIRISSAEDFLGTTPSYTFIKDPMLRLCHRLIACSIAGRSQAPEKVTVTDLFYLRGMDVGSVNVPYLLAWYLRLFSSRRKQGAMIFGELDDTWAWVPTGPARQEGDAGEVAEEAPMAPGGGDEDEEMPHAVPPPPRTQGKRIAHLEEEVHGPVCLTQDIRSHRLSTKDTPDRVKVILGYRPNTPSKTPSTKDTSSSSIDYIPKSPTSSTSSSTNGYLNSPTSPTPRVPSPPPIKESGSMDITLTLSPITLLDVQFNTPSPSPTLFGHPIPYNLLEAYGDSCLCFIHNRTLIFELRDELQYMFSYIEHMLSHLPFQTLHHH
ncbi:hypothetical protein Tco_0109633 [Tanacetum coccineum]